MSTNKTRTLTYHDLLSAQDSNIDSFLNKLNQQSAHKRRKSLNTRSQIKPYSHFIYKYSPLTTDDHRNFLRDYLVESRLWLSSPISFNDPFDMKCQFIFEGTLQDKRKFLDSKFQQHCSDLLKHVREETISDLLASDQFLPKKLKEIYEYQIAQHGVCCFTDDTRSTLMWAHYGSGHEGISLQFQICKDVFIFAHATAVNYSHEYPIINYLEENLRNALAKTLWQKSKDWEYENERRIIHPYGANSYLQFNPTALTALILGCKLKPDSENFIKTLLDERMQRNYPPVKIFRAIQDKTKYRIRLKQECNFLNSNRN